MKTIILTLMLVVPFVLTLPIEDKEITTTFNPIRDVAFLVFTRENPTDGQEVNINDMFTVRNSNYNSSRPTKMLIHGAWGDRYNPTNLILCPALLEAGDFNVIVVDWGVGAMDMENLMINYRAASVATSLFLNRLSDSGLLSFNDLTLIGHSMGAHVAGFTGKKVRGRINTIIGLDIANVGNVNDPATRLDSTDAEYVQIIQTETLFIAMSVPIAHANFYPGGGMFQPYCGGDFECNHMIAIDYFAESLTAVQNQFYAQRCSSMDEMRENACTTSDSVYLMGGMPVDRELRGIFRLPVNPTRPFAVGPLSVQ
ncbi:Pancreatic lipase-related protein 2 [Pseudolycoriella hygida]|uniref:Pancreatic lipase-related protein 2 n=1 Tax=Pseudolycoriella hygida TaxID=35572 RepID=A0A9Q0MLP9_9DIPT|nr:Pancreatic lipase-related protein 2 [Pseudolycoriella hygida]